MAAEMVKTLTFPRPDAQDGSQSAA
jgi:hypothetical protein